MLIAECWFLWKSCEPRQLTHRKQNDIFKRFRGRQDSSQGPAGLKTRRSGGNAISVFDNKVERASRERCGADTFVRVALERFGLKSELLTKLASVLTSVRREASCRVATSGEP